MHFVILMCLVATSLVAADGGASITPAPGFEPPKPGAQAQRPMMGPSMAMQRPVMAYEVESLVVAPGDPAGLAAWAELAAQGFHLVSVSQQDGKQSLFFERLRAPGATDIRLPGAISATPNLAQALEAKLLKIIADRQQAQNPPIRPAPAPVQEGK